jgi:hypothetical protein
MYPTGDEIGHEARLHGTSTIETSKLPEMRLSGSRNVRSLPRGIGSGRRSYRVRLWIKLFPK